MIKKYEQFINESIDFLLESNVVFSQKMKLALNKMDNELSNVLLDMENKDFPVTSNYFDLVNKKNDTISFIPDRKAQEILSKSEEKVMFTGEGGWLKHVDANKEIFDLLNYTPEGDPYSPSSSDIGDVIATVKSPSSENIYMYVQFENGKGVYNKNKLSFVDDSEKQLWSKSRQELKIGRAVRAILKAANKEFSDKEIEQFVNSFKATIDKLNDKFSLFSIVKESEIGHWYSYRNYLIRSGTLGGSCMSDVNVRYFDIYMSNPDVCQLVILKAEDNDDKIIGRALLWTLIDGKKFLDRIYTIKDSDVNLFRDYAKENGWYSKYYNSSTDNNTCIDPNNGENIRLNLTVNIKKGMYKGYPYLDTLKYWNPDDGVLSYDDEKGNYSLEDTSGGYSGGECENCGGEGRVSCYRCDGDGSYECPDCDGNGSESCNDCNGNGNIECASCDGSGQIEDGDLTKECPDCSGDGEIKCSNCDGDGEITCSRCDGDRSIECYNCDGDGQVDCSEC